MLAESPPGLRDFSMRGRAALDGTGSGDPAQIMLIVTLWSPRCSSATPRAAPKMLRPQPHCDESSFASKSGRA
jgi:hypothetical protein